MLFGKSSTCEDEFSTQISPAFNLKWCRLINHLRFWSPASIPQANTREMLFSSCMKFKA